MKFNCSYCGKENQRPPSKVKGKKLLFCNNTCHGKYMKEVMKPSEHNAWQGGVSHEESKRRWREKNKARINAMKRARQLRELNAPGSHTKEEWEEVKRRSNYQCAAHDESCGGGITKDHLVPLVMGGSNDVSNLQVLCRVHNSKKGRKVYLGQFDVSEPNL